MEIPKNWNFKNESVAGAFDSHVREQLPWYDLATFIVKHYIRAIVPQDGHIYDLGCSTGNLEVVCSDIIEDRRLQWLPIDNSKEMLSKYRGKKSPIIANIEEWSYEPFDIAICFLCLMFIDRVKRQSLLQRLYDTVNKYGAIIIFDKFIPCDGYIGLTQNKLAMAMKLEQGLNAKEILEKEISLIGSQIPMSDKELQGFNRERIFKVGDFEGFLLSPQLI